MAKYVRRNDLDGGPGVISHAYTAEGEDWPVWRLGAASHDGDVRLHITWQPSPNAWLQPTTLIPRPLLDELNVVVAEACGLIDQAEG